MKTLPPILIAICALLLPACSSPSYGGNPVDFTFQSQPEGAEIVLVDEEDWLANGGESHYLAVVDPTRSTTEVEQAKLEFSAWLAKHGKHKGRANDTIVITDYNWYWVAELDGQYVMRLIKPASEVRATVYFE